MNKDEAGTQDYGDVECIPVEKAPEEVVRTALKAANLIGDGLYGVDLKFQDRAYIIEINDNPSIDGDCEDEILGAKLYQIIMEDILRRVQLRAQGKHSYQMEGW